MTARLSNPAAAKEPRRVGDGTQLWKNRRAHQLQIEPLCRLCLDRGDVTPATVADHIEPHKGNYNAFVLGPAEEPLCAPAMMVCNRASNAEATRRAIGVDGYPVDRAHPFYRVRN